MEKEKLSALHDGDLAAAEKVEVEKHLSECAECRSELSDIRSASEAVRGLAPRPVPASVADTVAREIRHERGKVLDFFRFAAPLATAAAVVIVAVTVSIVSMKRAEREIPGSMAIVVKEGAPEPSVEQAKARTKKEDFADAEAPAEAKAAPLPASGKKTMRRAERRKGKSVPGTVYTTLAASHVGDVRRRVESIVRERKLPSGIGTGEKNQTHFDLDNYIYIECTEEELKELTAMLGLKGDSRSRLEGKDALKSGGRGLMRARESMAPEAFSLDAMEEDKAAEKQAARSQVRRIRLVIYFQELPASKKKDD